MQIHTISAGTFKLDGGAMFGVVPKTIWSKSTPADEKNLCTWEMRCLLLEIGSRLVLIDTGMGDKQPEKWQSYYYPQGPSLVESLHVKGFSTKEVTDVILSHLHFDHCGGAVQWNAARTGYEVTFPNATYWTHSGHWDWAMQPNIREKASFLQENLLPMQEAGQLAFIDKTPLDLMGVNWLTADGHTEKMLLPKISYHNKTIVFLADTIPSHAHLHIPYVMGYDVRPLQTMQEKETLLERAVAEQWIVVFDHDARYEAATVKLTDRGYAIDAMGALAEFI